MRVAFDVIGSKERAVAIVEMPESANAKKMAKEIMARHRNVKSVLAKISGRAGKFRTYKLKLIAGARNTEVLHREHGLFFKLDPKKVYFSPRESQERQNVANLVKANERVLVLFSGIGPFAIAIAKKQPSAQITAVDANKSAIKYAEENRALNRAWNVKNICCDIRKFKTNEKFDRIIMPLPENAWKFLPLTLKLAKNSAIIHLYAIASESKNFKDSDNKIPKGLKIIARHKVLPYAPRKWKVRLDLKVV